MADTSAPAEPATGAVPAPPEPAGGRRQAASEAALTRYGARMRRSRIIYFTLVAVIVAALGTWAGVTWSRGEAAHASLHTFAPAPPVLRLQTPSVAPQQAWQTSDRLAIGMPQWRGTVVTYSAHTVRGRDARTGKPTWSYTRTDRPVCTAAQFTDSNSGTGTTVAIYANHGNCDELSAFNSGTGRRRWTRTLDIDGMPVNGRPSYQTLPDTLLVATHTVIYAIDPGGGLNRWTYERYGCRINGVALGTAGALISQNCSDVVSCKDVKFCGRGPQLLLRNGINGRDDKAKPNADQVTWNRLGVDAMPVSADDVISAVDPSGATLSVFDASKGQQTRSIRLAPVSSGLAPIAAAATDVAELITISGRTYALSPDASRPRWKTATLSPPSVVSSGGESTPTLDTARITVAAANGVATLNGSDGKLLQRYPVPAPAAGSRVYPLGTGFLVGGPGGVVVYR